MAALAATRHASAAQPGTLRFGLTPVFLSSDLELLARLETYLGTATGYPVELVTRRTYQEITTLLVSGELDAAWICGYPYVAFRDRLSLVAVPVWRGRPLYQSYLIVASGRAARAIGDLEGEVHAFSDPDSNSGFLVTAAELAAMDERPETFFGRTLFTYSHRNVVRAVASGLAASGSVDGYVYEVLKEVSPDLVARTAIVRASGWNPFPPIACPLAYAASAKTDALRNALMRMPGNAEGTAVLDLLRLDGFALEQPGFFEPIRVAMESVRRLG
nr:PhnD/SsuA/transferrin family substrate-binding protein [Methylobrevis pamukkalensis]